MMEGGRHRGVKGRDGTEGLRGGRAPGDGREGGRQGMGGGCFGGGSGGVMWQPLGAE